MKSIEDIASIATQRHKAASVLHARMAELEDVVYGRANVDLPELNANERAAVPNLISRGLNQLAMRVASTSPMPVFTPLRQGIKVSEQRARDRRDVMLGWWQSRHGDHGNLDLLRRKRARHLLGYATSPVQMRVDFQRKMPTWEVRSPRECLPPPGCALVPEDCIFTYMRPASWVRREYPGSLGFLANSEVVRHDTQVRIVEYTDAEQCTILAMGNTTEPVAAIDTGWSENWRFSGASGRGTDWAVRLTSHPNRAGRPLVTMPWSISLAEPDGVFNQSLSLYLKQARLMALEEIAIERGIFPEPWLSANGPATPQVLVPADGRDGTVGIVKDGSLAFNAPQPGFAALQAIDRYERAIRVTSGIPADFGGESASNIRTGRRGESVMSATVDFDIQEAQELLAASQQEEDRIAIAIDKGYFSGSKPINVAWKGASSPRSYDTAATWETDDHIVKFSITGSDANALTVQVGQLVGTGLMSQQSAREMHPYITDAEVERDRLTSEGLHAALLSSIQAQAADPAGPYQPDDLAFLAEQVLTNKMELPAAIMAAQRRAQERQAASGPVGAPDGPVMPGSPEAQPGLAAPGMGAEAPAAVPEPGPSMDNLAQMLNQLRTTGGAMSRAERGAA